MKKLALVTKFESMVVGTPKTMDEKLAAAIAYLGDRWCHHPNFKKDRLRTGYLQQWRASRPSTRKEQSST